MKLRTVGAVLVAMLLLQGAPVVPCASSMERMPCCASSADCGASFSVASCCGFNAPAESRSVAAAQTAPYASSPTFGPAALTAQSPVALPPDAIPTGCTASFPHSPPVPLYLRLSSLLC